MMFKRKKKLKGYGGTAIVFDDPIKERSPRTARDTEHEMLMAAMFGVQARGPVYAQRDKSRSVSARASQVPGMRQQIEQILKDVEFLMQRADAEDLDE